MVDDFSGGNDSLQRGVTHAGTGTVTPTIVPPTQTTKDFGFLPIPHHLRYSPGERPSLGLPLNIAFGFASTFTIANLYYCQPLLIQLSISFNVSYSKVSRIPTLVQAGYAVGLVFISPMADLFRRRALILFIVFLSTCLTVGLSVTKSLAAFEALSFLVGVLTVTTPILFPIVADLAPPNRRASSLSIVLSGLLFGVLIARVLAGVIAQFTSWEVVYYFAAGVQTVVLVGCYLLLPDYTSQHKNDEHAHRGLAYRYGHILVTMAKFSVTEPLLVQAVLLTLPACAAFSNFWVTLTFLLGAPPYNYSTLVIGLFGLVGMVGVASSPLVGRFVDGLVPWYAALLATVMHLVFQSIQTGAGGLNVGAVILSAFGVDVFRQMQHVSLTTSIFSLPPEARVRVNAVLILSVFIGQVMGTAVGTRIFLQHGWRASAGFSMALYGFQIIVFLLRGPHVPRHKWFGYDGGMEWRKNHIGGDENNHEHNVEVKTTDTA